MSSFVIHLIIPILVALALGIFRPRDAWTWSWAAWAVDVDYVGWALHVEYGWPNFHRALFHNVWWFVLLAALAWRALGKFSAAGGGGLLTFARAKPGWLLVPYYYASHLILDLFAGGIVPFWPASNLGVFWDFQIDVDTTKAVPQPQIISEVDTYVGVPDVSQVYTWMTAEHFSIFLLYLVTWGAFVAYHRLRQPSGIAA